MSQLSVNILGLLVIAFIVWWFWLSKPQLRKLQKEGLVEILVEDVVDTH